MSKTILLWNRDNLIGSALEGLLSACQDIDLIRVMEEADLDGLIETVGRVKPDIVILNQDDPSFDVHLPVLLIHDQPNIKVITLGLQDNCIEVYDRHRVWVRERADLLAAIDL